MVGDNRAPSTIWGLRYDPGSGYVRTLPGDRIGVYLPDGRGMVSGLQMSRADARLVAKRINQCLDATVKR